MNALVHFRLYVAGNAPHSQKAALNLRTFCSTYLADRHQVEIVDLLTDPRRALTDKVLLTPTLAVTFRGTTRRIAGDLSDTSVLIDIIEGGAPQS